MVRLADRPDMTLDVYRGRKRLDINLSAMRKIGVISHNTSLLKRGQLLKERIC